jgi:hypothetical protein
VAGKIKKKGSWFHVKNMFSVPIKEGAGLSRLFLAVISNSRKMV